MKLIVSYKPTNDLDTFIFEYDRPRIRHSQVHQVKLESMYVQVASQSLLPIREKIVYKTSIFDLKV